MCKKSLTEVHRITIITDRAPIIVVNVAHLAHEYTPGILTKRRRLARRLKVFQSLIISVPLFLSFSRSRLCLHTSLRYWRGGFCIEFVHTPTLKLSVMS